MASYSLDGDIMLGGVSKWLASIDPTSKKNRKAALKTLARFDPTAKNAKYGYLTKGVLLGGAALTGGLLLGGTALASLSTPLIKVGTGAAASGLISTMLPKIPATQEPQVITPLVDSNVIPIQQGYSTAKPKTVPAALIGSCIIITAVFLMALRK